MLYVLFQRRVLVRYYYKQMLKWPTPSLLLLHNPVQLNWLLLIAPIEILKTILYATQDIERAKRFIIDVRTVLASKSHSPCLFNYCTSYIKNPHYKMKSQTIFIEKWMKVSRTSRYNSLSAYSLTCLEFDLWVLVCLVFYMIPLDTFCYEGRTRERIEMNKKRIQNRSGRTDRSSETEATDWVRPLY